MRKKKHTNWELFTSISYTWDMLEKNVLPSKLSPNRSTWDNLEKYNVNWFTITSTQFERRKKKFSWRYPTFGFRLYQVNDYRPNKTTNTQRPYNAMIEAWDIGFKPMRASRV